MSNQDIINAKIASEEQLIGSILIFSAGGNRDCIDLLRIIIKQEDFSDLDFARIYKAMILCPEIPQLDNVVRSLIDNNLTHSKGLGEDRKILLYSIANNICSIDYEYYADNILHYKQQLQMKQPPKFKGGAIL